MKDSNSINFPMPFLPLPHRVPILIDDHRRPPHHVILQISAGPMEEKGGPMATKKQKRREGRKAHRDLIYFDFFSFSFFSVL